MMSGAAVSGTSALPKRSGMLQPQYSDWTMRAFEMFFLPWRSRRLITRFIGEPPHVPDDAPVLFVANHTSWWDGFLLRDVQRTLRPGASLYSVMTARELDRNPFLRRIGAVPLEPSSSASVLALLRILRDIARTQRAVSISYFPQGRIAPAWQRPLGFRRGVELLVRAIQPCWIIPVGLHIEPLNATRPTAFVAAGTPLRVTDEGVAVEGLEQLVTDRLDEIAARLRTGLELQPPAGRHA